MFLAGKYSVKAIDLESFTASNSPLSDFSPEVLAPEHATRLAEGSLRMVGRGDYRLDLQEPILADPKADIWALGVELLHLYLGR